VKLVARSGLMPIVEPTEVTAGCQFSSTKGRTLYTVGARGRELRDKRVFWALVRGALYASHPAITRRKYHLVLVNLQEPRDCHKALLTEMPRAPSAMYPAQMLLLRSGG
jgi:hypothetical protein